MKKYTEEEIRGFFVSFRAHCESLSKKGCGRMESLRKIFGGKTKAEIFQELVGECMIAISALSRDDYLIAIEVLDKIVRWHENEIKRFPNRFLIFSSGYRTVIDSITMMRGMKIQLEKQCI